VTLDRATGKVFSLLAINQIDRNYAGTSVGCAARALPVLLGLYLGVAELQYESLWDWNILKFEVVEQQSN
jgi:hypothetical protein